MKKLLLIAFLLITPIVKSQTITDLINQVSLDSLTLTLNEFSGEIPTVVNGNTVTILNRVSNSDNNLAAEYLIQKLNAYGNLTVTDQVYSAGGRNIIAVQEGKTNPNDIYIICAHYDSVANYCADDNVSGTAAVLEVARILSTQCIDNTIVYALWDEEEIGLIGAGYYANQAATNGDNILGVLNMDMMAYDGDNDNDFDIDVRPIANSIAMKDDIISILINYGFNLNENVVNPGTTASDHSKFWNQGYSAVLLGESWFNNDQTPDYHTSGDKLSTLNLPYFHEMTKLVMAYTATKASLVPIDNLVTQNVALLTSNQVGASYQWINCDTNLPISGETNQTFTATTNGNYAVEITSGTCTETSECTNVSLLNTNNFSIDGLNIYPNPMFSVLNIELSRFEDASFQILSLNGQIILSNKITEKNQQIDVAGFSKGIYFIHLKVDDKTINHKLIKH